MWRIHSPGADANFQFTEGNPTLGIRRTVMGAEWANDVQEELCSVIESQGIVLQPVTRNQLLQAILSIVSGGGSGAAAIGTNQIINGEFAIFQRATSAPGGVLTRVLGAGVTAYCLDRWESSDDGASGTGVATISRQAFSPGQTDVPGNPSWFIRHLQSISANTANPFLRTKLEDVAHYSGGPFSFSIYAKANANLNATLTITQKFGSGGSPDVVIATAPITIGTALARYSVSGTLTSVNGKTVGAGNHLELKISFPTAATFTVDMADAQGEPNAAPTVFARRARAVELTLAERYFEKSWPADVAAATCPGPNLLDGASAGFHGITNGALTEILTPFRVEKRTSPTIVWFSPGDQAAGKIQRDNTDVTVTGVSDSGPRSTGWPSIAGSSTGLIKAHWTADAEI